MPIWDQQANQSRSAAANLFCYHMLGNFIVILLIMTILFRHYTKIGLINNVDEKTLRITLSRSKYHEHQLKQPLQNSQSLLEKQQQTFIIDNHSEQIELCNSNYSNTIETNEIDQNEQDQ
ncbi:unnamed protein product [Schistosoma turkestanicum]|nr:unnamed protein product [Schistosoma turkestanicum]